MPYRLVFARRAAEEKAQIEAADPAKYRKVLKTLALLESNPRHPSLETHKYTSLSGPNEEEVFEAYVENQTPAAFRVFWYYGPTRGDITIMAITRHP